MTPGAEGSYAPVQADNDAPAVGSVDIEDVPVEPVGRKYSRRAIAGGMTAVVGTALVIMLVGAKVAFNGDVVATDRVVGLATKVSKPSAAELETEIRTQIADFKKDQPEAWSQMKEMRKAENQRKTRKLIEHFNTKSPEEVRKVVDDVVQKAASKAVAAHKEHTSKDVFRELKKFQDKNPVAPWVKGVKDFHADQKALKDIRLNQEAQATCVFSSIRSAQYIATAAFNIENSRSTCPNSKGLRQKICAVNALLIVNNIQLLAASLAGAASVCAESINVRALCAASVTGLVSALSLEAAAGIVISAGCKPIQQFIKDNAKTGVSLTEGKRRLEDDQSHAGAPVDSALAAPSRRLFLGGNKAITAAQCATDITTTAWSIAGIGLGIAGATDACKHTVPTNAQDLLQAVLLRKALCSADVNSILYNFGSVATFLQIAVIHCGGGLNLQVICGAGISGMLAATAGLGRAVSGLYSACDIGIKLDTLQNVIGGLGGVDAEQANVDLAIAESTRRLKEDPVGYLREQRDAAWHVQASAHGLNMSYGEARRLQGLDDPMEGLDGSEDPKELWARMGYDMNDPNADWIVDANEVHNDHEADDAFVRVMEPYLHEVGETLDEETKKKWPLWPSPFEDEL